MGGIAGFTDYDRDARENRVAAERMARALTPRGPDAGGFFFDKAVALISRRLAISDALSGT